MSVEARRGCGYRQVGGLYLVSGNLSQHCGRLPLELHVCPTCHAGIKQTRGWTWITPRELLKDARPCNNVFDGCRSCPLSPDHLPDRAGLIWIGERFYPTAEDFMREAVALGVSRRIPAVPRDFKLGETWVLFAHPKAVEREPVTEEEIVEAGLAAATKTGANLDFRERHLIQRPGIVTMFKPTAIEKIVTASQAQDEKEMQALRDRGITPVIVPDDDPDHNPKARAKNRAQMELTEEEA